MLSELDNYLHRIEDLHSQINQLLVELPTDGLNWRPFGEDGEHSTNSLGVLAAHVAGAEHYWISEVIAGQEPTRDRDAEFLTSATTASSLIQILDDTLIETKAILSSLTISDLDQLREARSKSVPVRWAILHVIDHTALHLGHMQLTLQLWSQGKSQPSAYWYERLPKGND